MGRSKWFIKWSIFYQQKSNTTTLRSDLYNYSDACILTKGIIGHLAAVANKNDKAEKNVALKNNAPLRTCISKILMLIC